MPTRKPALLEGARGDAHAKVRKPVHVLYYRTIQPGSIEVLRVLHERMEPSRHIATVAEDKT